MMIPPGTSLVARTCDCPDYVTQCAHIGRMSIWIVPPPHSPAPCPTCGDLLHEDSWSVGESRADNDGCNTSREMSEAAAHARFYRLIANALET